MEFPSDVLVSLLARNGTIFLIDDGEFFEGEKKHFFVVCNNADSSKVVILVVATSQVARRKERVRVAGLDPTTQVVVPANTYKCFPNETLFDCNSIFETNVSKLVDLHKKGKMKVMSGSIISDKDMAHVINGISISKIVPEEIKNIVKST